MNNALDEIAAIRDMLAAMSVTVGQTAYWDSNNKRSRAHLADAWASVGWAIRALWFEQRDRTRAEEIDASVGGYRHDITELRAEIERLKVALAAAQVGMSGHPMPAPDHLAQDEVVQRLRRTVMGALHPDKASSKAESAWRTALCQSLFPEIERIVGGR